MRLLETVATYPKQVLESATGYGTGIVLFLQDVNWAVLGGVILFIARAAVDIPKAIDYWKERKKV